MTTTKTQKPTAVSIGKTTELIAVNYLKKHGLRIIHTNYRCKMGEIDIIAKDAAMIVFVEVRYRRSTQFGSALESLTPQKLHRLQLTASYFLTYNPWTKLFFSRFDVITISPKNSDRIANICTDSVDINWIKNAFSCE